MRIRTSGVKAGLSVVAAAALAVGAAAPVAHAYDPYQGGYWSRPGERRHHNDRRYCCEQDWRGPRTGFWYAPGYGYYRVEAPWRDYAWRRGDRVPPAYCRYVVREPHRYGLRRGPYGSAWVHLNGDLALVDLRSGLILDLAPGAY